MNIIDTIGRMFGDPIWRDIRREIPKVGQNVWYYFHVVGTHQGVYEGMTEHGHLFTQRPGFGFLAGDVTHWMPRECSKEMPLPPGEEENLP